jgi:hypothetical protein
MEIQTAVQFTLNSVPYTGSPCHLVMTAIFIYIEKQVN